MLCLEKLHTYPKRASSKTRKIPAKDDIC